MNQFYYVLLFYVFMVTCSAQYYIRDDEIPSYLYHKFNNISNEIFPEDFKIIMSLSRISGTLWYSIDRNMNQLIVSLYSYTVPTIFLEFRKQLHTASIPDLCVCQMCRFEKLSLRIQVKNNIRMQCNNGDVMVFPVTEIKGIKGNYPNPYKNINLTTSTKTGENEAYLWLVNRPQDNNIYPNMEQLSGCIFNVSYNGQPIKFTNVSSNIKWKCEEACNDNICNGGMCYETYNALPICNCTMTFQNGPNCTEQIGSQNRLSEWQQLQLEILKLSWKSSSKEIFKISNKSFQIRLFQKRNALLVAYQHNNGKESIVIEKLSKQYTANEEAILVAVFYNTYIHCQLFQGAKISATTIPTDRNLKNVIFDSVMLQSGSGLIDLVYKRSKTDLKWSRIIFTNESIITDEPIFVMDQREIRNIVVIVVLILAGSIVPIIGLVCFIMGFIIKRKRKKVKDLLDHIDAFVDETELERIAESVNELKETIIKQKKDIMKKKEDQEYTPKTSKQELLESIQIRKDIERIQKISKISNSSCQQEEDIQTDD